MQAYGTKQARIDDVELHAVGDSQLGNSFGKRVYGGFDGASDGELGAGRAAAGTRDVDHGAVRGFEMRPGRAGQAHRAEKFEGEAVGPVLVGEFEEGVALRGAGIVDDDVDTLVDLHREVHQPGRVFRHA